MLGVGHLSARRGAGQAVSRARHKKAPRHVDTEMRVQPMGFNRLTRSRPIGSTPNSRPS